MSEVDPVGNALRIPDGQESKEGESKQVASVDPGGINQNINLPGRFFVQATNSAQQPERLPEFMPVYRSRLNDYQFYNFPTQSAYTTYTQPIYSESEDMTLYAESEDVASYVKSEDAISYAKSEDVAQYCKSEDVVQYSSTPKSNTPESSGRRNEVSGRCVQRHACKHKDCGKSFTTSAHLSRHVKLHTGQKPHRCPLTGCKKGFARRDNMLVHYRTHARKVGAKFGVITGVRRASSGSIPQAYQGIDLNFPKLKIDEKTGVGKDGISIGGMYQYGNFVAPPAAGAVFGGPQKSADAVSYVDVPMVHMVRGMPGFRGTHPYSPKESYQEPKMHRQRARSETSISRAPLGALPQIPQNAYRVKSSLSSQESAPGVMMKFAPVNSAGYYAAGTPPVMGPVSEDQGYYTRYVNTGGFLDSSIQLPESSRTFTYTAAV